MQTCTTENRPVHEIGKSAKGATNMFFLDTFGVHFSEKVGLGPLQEL